MPQEKLHQSQQSVEKKPKKERKVLSPQTKELIINVVNFMRLEANGKFMIPPRKVQCRAAVATGFSERTVRRVVKESRSLPEVVTSNGLKKATIFPSKKPPNRPKPKTGLDELTRSTVRKIIHNFYINDKTVPTIKKVYQKLIEEIGFKGSSRSAHQIVKELGFNWKKTKSRSFILVEKHEIRLSRIEYLRTVIKYREEGRAIVYIGNSLITSNYFQSKKGKTFENKVGVLHAGGESGLMLNALKLIQPEKTLDNYLNFTDLYYNWFKNSLLPYFSPKTILVVDSTFYQNIQCKKIPTLNSSADEMKMWLKSKKIMFQDDLSRPELYQIIKKHAFKFRKDEDSITHLLHEQGHTLLKLPPNHSDLNPVSIILAQLKPQIPNTNMNDTSNLLFQYQDRLKEMCGSFLTLCNHVKCLEQQYLKNEHVIDNEIEKIILKSRIDKGKLPIKSNFRDSLMLQDECKYDFNSEGSFIAF